MKLVATFLSSVVLGGNPLCAIDGIEYRGNDIVGSDGPGSIADVGMPDNCAENCRFAAGCIGWSYRKSRYECYLHTSTNRRERETGWICGDQKNNKFDSYKYEDSMLITGAYIPGIKDGNTCQFMCQTSRYCFYWSHFLQTGACYLKTSGAGKEDPINHGKSSGWYSGWYVC